jgi:hypothetical protein
LCEKQRDEEEERKRKDLRATMRRNANNVNV